MTGPARPRTGDGPDDASEDGGDPACWLARVCPECGLFAEDEPPTTCSRCGTHIVSDEPSTPYRSRRPQALTEEGIGQNPSPAFEAGDATARGQTSGYWRHE
jgi:hypothetical protein